MGTSLYIRISRRVFFIFPTVAVGFDEDGLFFEVAWLNYAIGIGGA